MMLAADRVWLVVAVWIEKLPYPWYLPTYDRSALEP